MYANLCFLDIYKAKPEIKPIWWNSICILYLFDKVAVTPQQTDSQW